MTYDELGRIRGIGRESAVKLVQRKRWQRTKGNDKEARIFVPLDWLLPAREASPQPSPDIPQLVAAFETAIGALTVRAERAEADADRLRTRLEAAEAHAAALERAQADRASWSRWRRLRAVFR